MPQMMPLNWLLLYTMFMAIFMFFIMINYYMTHFKYQNNLLLKSSKNPSYPWQW